MKVTISTSIVPDSDWLSVEGRTEHLGEDLQKAKLVLMNNRDFFLASGNKDIFEGFSGLFRSSLGGLP